MNIPKSSTSFKDWLDNLQQESWQLELIISGFSIFGLVSIFEPLGYQYELATNLGNDIKATLISVTLTSSAILTFNLIIHVILRGLWIGALGLRYVSGDIDFDTLNYYSKFDKFLRKRVPSFDKFIEKLENYCSIIFATSFLMIFYFIAFILCLVLFVLLIELISSLDSDILAYKILGIALIAIYTLTILLALIDFVTLGYLKKKKWLAIIYYPFYRFISLITLSFLYRNLVYNFLDNKLGRRISYILFPIYLFLFIMSTVEFESSNYFFFKNKSSIVQTKIAHYEDLLTEEKEFIDKASIPSKIITTPYLPIFIEFDDNIEDNIIRFNDTLKIEKESRGLSIKLIDGLESDRMVDSIITSIRPKYLKTLESFFTISIDTTACQNVAYNFTENKFNQIGFETVIKISSLNEGKHTLIIDKHIYRKDSLIKTNHIKIPFWYYTND